MSQEIQHMVIQIIRRGDPVFLESLKDSLRSFLSDLGNEYPFFLAWLDKVFYELSVSDRRIIILSKESDGFESILGVAILKNTQEERKICTLRVAEEYRRQGVGTALLEKSIKILGDSKPLITVSGLHMSSFGPFLKKNGFALKDKVKSIYRRGNYEYFFNQSYVHRVALLSIQPEYVKAIVSGEKKVEFRKKVFVPSVEKVYIYSSSPVKRIVGYFLVTEIIHDTPAELWNRFSSVGSISKLKYDNYFAGHEKAFGIRIDTLHIFNQSIDPREFDCHFRAPQSYCYIDNVEFMKWLTDKER